MKDTAALADTERRRRTLRYSSPRLRQTVEAWVGCPQCGVARGERCRTRSGREASSFHRWREALNDDPKAFAAYLRHLGSSSESSY